MREIYGRERQKGKKGVKDEYKREREQENYTSIPHGPRKIEKNKGKNQERNEKKTEKENGKIMTPCPHGSRKIGKIRGKNQEKEEKRQREREQENISLPASTVQGK